MDSKISIIIPVYNVDRYIVPCFQSILDQKYRNFEVLLIDDGSTDRSGEICDEYVAKDPRFSVVHTENRGIGTARNIGLRQMTGEYCFFLDPDDLLAPDCLSYMVSLMENHSADLVLGRSSNFSTPEPEYPKEENAVETVYQTHQSVMESVLFDKSDMKPLERKQEPSLVNYEFFSTLYRTKLFKDHDIRFLDISYGEDTYVCLKCLIFSHTVVTTGKTTYWHRRNPTSTTFQYHENYLEETRKYYSEYCGLFRENAPEYLERAEIGLKGQYYRRCLSAIDREINFAHQRKLSEIKAVLTGIAGDEIYRQYMEGNRSFVRSRHIRNISLLMRCKLFFLCALYAKMMGVLRKK